MPREYIYHKPNAPHEDSDSDIELDLQELGPTRSKTSLGPHTDTSYGHSGAGDQIRLQRLQRGQTKASGGRTEENNVELDGTAEDDTHNSADSRKHTDPLLLWNTESDAQSTGRRYKKISGRIRLPGFGLHGSTYAAVAQAETETTGETSTSAPRSIKIGQHPASRYPVNAVSNAKYSPWDFLPRTLYNEFSYFINMYFLLIALSQVIPPLQIGSLWTYFAPLVFVLGVTLGKEAYDDVTRRKRDSEANREAYTRLRLERVSRKGGRLGQTRGTRAASTGQHRLAAIEDEEEHVGDGEIRVDEALVKSKDIKVGDVLKLGKDDRVPADVVILKSLAAESAANNVNVIPVAGTNADYESEVLFSINDGAYGATHDEIESTIRPGEQTERSSQADHEKGSGETFIRTDQLDGETDWKLRIASPLTQMLQPEDFTRLTITADKPSKEVNEFVGRLELQPRIHSKPGSQLELLQQGQDRKFQSAPLTIDNTAWANTVLASNATVLAVVIYTGAQTRQALSTSSPRSKVGLLELEINNLTKFLCLLTVTLSCLLGGLQYLDPSPKYKWYISVFRFLILFSTIIPISLRVNLDFGKSVYAYFIHGDADMPGAVVRTSTIPEDLGRIEYLLSDKTGTLTQNEMDLKKIHIGTVSYANEAMEEVASYVRQGFAADSSDINEPVTLLTPSLLLNAGSNSRATTRTRREVGSRVRDIVLALALCHNVTPTTEEDNGNLTTTYQASSPDEIAIVRWTESVGIRLVHRDRHSIALQSIDSSRIVVRLRVLEMFPFTSEGKRMGIIVQYLEGSESASSSNTKAGEIWFYQKGADTVMTKIVAVNDWLDEETTNMAREGLRTLVVGRRKLSAQQYADFALQYKEAASSLHDRDVGMARVISTHLEHNLELLGITGVEDKLQKDVKPSIELLRNAGIKIWMLTGDKVETARCVAVSSRLVSRTQHISTITALDTLAAQNPQAANDALALLATNPSSTAMLIDGDSLSYLLAHHRHAFIEIATRLPAVIACRCSPTQKADVALLIRAHTRKRTACIGDGGNDVSMIQAADVGVGIVGKEGRQASLAADFSITQFCHLTKLLVWHGRNSYKRSAKLALFVMHRGLMVSVAQAVYSASTGFRAEGLVTNWLLIAYPTFYTQFIVFSLVLDRDVDEKLAKLYPELYKELTAGRSLSRRTFLTWCAVSVYQGAVIQLLSQLLVDGAATAAAAAPGPDKRMLAVSYSVLILNELTMVAMEIKAWHWIMLASLAGEVLLYVATVPFLADYFDLAYMWTWAFAWRVAAIAALSLVPPYVVKLVMRTVKPPSYRKVRG